MSSRCRANCNYNFTCDCCSITFSCLCNLHSHMLANSRVKQYLVDLVTTKVEVICHRECDSIPVNHKVSCSINANELCSTSQLIENDYNNSQQNLGLIGCTVVDDYNITDEDSSHEGDVVVANLDSHSIHELPVGLGSSRHPDNDPSCSLCPSTTLLCKPTITDEDSEEKSNCADKVPCDVCGHMFKKRNLKRHRESHTETKHYSCDICPKRFKTQSQLYGHKLHHNSEKLCTCHLCGKSFNNGPNLRQHIKTHTRERTLNCPVCSKSFASNYVFKDHMLRHSEEKPHSCSVCHRVFRKQQEVKRHMIMHTDARDHPCSYCSKMFKTRSNRFKHEKTHAVK